MIFIWSIAVRLGEWNRTSVKDCVDVDDCSADPIDIEIDSIKTHPSFVAVNLSSHDIALIRLKSIVKFTGSHAHAQLLFRQKGKCLFLNKNNDLNLSKEWISPICMPSETLQFEDVVGQLLVVAGWGRTELGMCSVWCSVSKLNQALSFVYLYISYKYLLRKWKWSPFAVVITSHFTYKLQRKNGQKGVTHCTGATTLRRWRCNGLVYRWFRWTTDDNRSKNEQMVSGGNCFVRIE